MDFRYQKQFGLIFASRNIFGNYFHQYKTIQIMKKILIIALSCLVVLFAACKKKPVEPTPVDYTANYVGNYIGQFTLSITSMNNSAVSNMSFPIDSIRMDIAKGSEANAITATVTVDNESHQSSGTATAEKADFGTVRLVIDKPDQNYSFNLDLVMEGTKAVSDSLNIVGTFSGNGSANIMGQEQVFNEVSGTINGKLGKQ
jgi:hypothetical protein